MTGIGLDTSVIVRLLCAQPPTEFAVAKQKLLAAYQDGEPVYVTDIAISEAWWVMKVVYKSEPDAVRAGMRAMFESGLVQAEPQSDVYRALKDGRKGPGFIDRLICYRHDAAKWTTWTFDKEMAKLERVERLGS